MSTNTLNSQQQAEITIALRTLGLSSFTQDPAYAKRKIGEDNWGLRAKRYIRPGTLILEEKPLFYICRRKSDLSVTAINEIRRKRDANPDFNKLFCPAIPKVTAANPTGDQTPSRFQFNRFQLSLPEERQAIFYIASRLNHSCLPNAFFEWNPKSGHLTVYAIRDIQKGEEILVSYMNRDWHLTRHERQEALFDGHEFDCDCEACHQGPGLNALRAYGREQISTIWTRAKAYDDYVLANVPTPEKRLQHFFTLKNLRERVTVEGLAYPALASVCKRLADHCNEELGLRQGWYEDQLYPFKMDGLEAARDKLRLDIMANGQDAPMIADTLRWMAGLAFGQGLCSAQLSWMTRFSHLLCAPQ